MNVTDSPVPGAIVTGAVTCILLWLNPSLMHWSILPISACGVLAAWDATGLFTGKRQILDPIGLVGVFAWNFLFLAPLLHVAWDTWVPYVDIPTEMRPWLGLMGMLNFTGLLLYRFIRRATMGTSLDLRRRSAFVERWEVYPRLAIGMLVVMIVIGCVLQAGVYISFGGAGNFSDVATSAGIEQGELKGLGWILIIAESTPVLLAMLVAVLVQRTGSARVSRAAALTWLACLLPTVVVFGGLRQSRSNWIFSVIIIVGIFHFFVRRFSRAYFVGAVITVLPLLYLSSFYKTLGVEAVNAFASGGIAQLEDESRRNFEGVILFDLARADVQALILQRQETQELGYDLSFGRSYLGAAALVIPERFWPGRPTTKRLEGTNALYGEGSYESGAIVSPRIYGLVGEAMLNFGWPAVPIGYAVFGAIVGLVVRRLRRLSDRDSRLLVAPAIIVGLLVVMLNDSNNVLWFFFRFAALPLLVVVVASKRRGTGRKGVSHSPAVYREQGVSVMAE